MIKVEFQIKRQYNLTGVQYDITDCPNSMMFAYSNELGVFRVFNAAPTMYNFVKRHQEDGWKTLGSPKFAAWRLPENFHHDVHSGKESKNTNVFVVLGKNGYDMVKNKAGHRKMASYVRGLIANDLNVKEEELIQ